jgi:hypothetical protein
LHGLYTEKQSQRPTVVSVMINESQKSASVDCGKNGKIIPGRTI